MFPWSPLFSNRDFEGPSGKDMNTSSFKYSTVTKKINPDGVSGKSFEFLQKKKHQSWVFVYHLWVPGI